MKREFTTETKTTITSLPQIVAPESILIEKFFDLGKGRYWMIIDTSGEKKEEKNK